jgi:protein TonB
MAKENYKSLDDIVFENRHKGYGAYDLRMSERSILLRAFLVGIFIIGLVTAGVYTYNAVFTKADKEETVVDINLENVDEPIIEEEEVIEETPPPPPPPEQEIAQVNAVIPEPKEDVKIEVPPAKQDDMKDKQISNVDKEGEKTNTIISQPKQPEGTGTVPAPPAPAPVGNFTARQVNEMAVFPGCEKFKGDKTKLTQCMSQKLNEELGDQLSDFSDNMSNRGESSAVAKVRFVIDKSGKIVQVQALQGGSGGVNAELGRESEKALKTIATRLSSRGKIITPAKLEDGSSVNLQFDLPVTWKAAN